jgi:hypothetical protein
MESISLSQDFKLAMKEGVKEGIVSKLAMT